jgi:hypothetical protein
MAVLGRKRRFAITSALVPLLAREPSFVSPRLWHQQSTLSAKFVEKQTL